ncbi:MAG: hypothetical protein II932_09550, partial [Treponema sp.]|nr:hypothetical protein [Treponema sp.]
TAQDAYSRQDTAGWDTAGAQDVTAHEAPQAADNPAPWEQQAVPPADVINLPPPGNDGNSSEI